jgi:hypothetical protein
MHMAMVLTILLVLAAFAVRLMMPPVPGLIATYYRRWGKRTVISLCAVAGACAALAIFIARS